MSKAGRCLGRFFIHWNDIFDEEKMVREFLDGILIIHADWRPDRQQVEYIGLSKKHFKEVPKGHQAYTYPTHYVNTSTIKTIQFTGEILD